MYCLYLKVYLESEINLQFFDNRAWTCIRTCLIDRCTEWPSMLTFTICCTVRNLRPAELNLMIGAFSNVLQLKAIKFTCLVHRFCWKFPAKPDSIVTCKSLSRTHGERTWLNINNLPHVDYWNGVQPGSLYTYIRPLHSPLLVTGESGREMAKPAAH